MKVILRAADLSVRLAGNLIVERATLDLEAGALTVLIGPNGAGKTTLMRALAGLLPAEGCIELQGRPLQAFSVRERARQIAYLPQGHVFHWPMSVAAVVALGRHPHADAFSPLADRVPTRAYTPVFAGYVRLLARAAHDGGAVLAIVHDLALAARFADRVVMMDRGRLVAAGGPQEVLTPERIAEVFAVEATITDSAVGPIPILHRPL